MVGEPQVWGLSKTVVVVASLVLAFLLPTTSFAVTSVSSSNFPNTGDVHWTVAGSPYVVTASVSKRYGTFTVDPGVVVKFVSGATLSTHADVVTTIVGTENEPIYFTSYKDDSVGGDTNGDLAATAPAPGDWGSTAFGGGSANNAMRIEYLKVRFAGSSITNTTQGTVRYALAISYPWYSGSPGRGYTLQNIEVSESLGAGLYVSVGQGNSLSVTQSSFFNNATRGLLRHYTTNLSGQLVSGAVGATDNWWGDASGPYHATLNPTGVGNPVDPTVLPVHLGGSVSFIPWLTTNPIPDPVPAPTCCSSVLFLPGLKGSRLTYGSDTLWPPTAPSTFSSDVEQLALNPDGTSVNDVKVDGVLDTFYTTPIYSGFTSYLDQLVTDNVIKDWEPLPYDWRLSPERIVNDGVELESGVLDLADEVERLAGDSYSRKVMLVAHSYGGLVAKSLVAELQARGKDELIESLVLVGSPQLGTPQAIASLLHGAGESIGLGFIVNPATSRQVALNMESAYHLLPSQMYFSRVGEPIITFDPDASFTQEWRDFWGEGISNYINFFGFVTGAGVIRTDPNLSTLRIPEIGNPTLLTNANTYHSAYDSFVYPPHINVVQIAGWGLPTVKSVQYTTEHLVQSYNVSQTIEGDGTVVYPSAAVGGNSYYFNLFDFNKLPGADFQHRDLLNAADIQSIITSVLNLLPLSNSNYVTNVRPTVGSIENLLKISTHSPIVVGAYDSQGRFTGVDPSQDLSSELLSIRQEIPGSYFLETGESHSIYLPNDGQYSFVVKGLASGPASIEISTFSEASSTLAAAFTDFAVSDLYSGSFTIDALEPQEVQLAADTDGDGDVDLVQDSDLKKKPLTVRAINTEVILGSEIPHLSVEFSGFVGTDTVANSVTGTADCTTTATAQSPVGVYPITCALGTLESSRYEFIDFDAGTLTITYGWSGFLRPISMDTEKPSIFKSGTNIPVKFQLFDVHESVVQAARAPIWLLPEKGDPLNEPHNHKKRPKSGTKGSEFRWDKKERQYVYNWDTRGTEKGFWYEIRVQLDDGTIRTALIGLK